MNIENIQNERELLCELYSFTASNGEIYYIKPATLADVINPQSAFANDIRFVSPIFLSDTEKAKAFCHTILTSDTVLQRLFEKYVYCNEKPVVFDDLMEKDTITAEDIIAIVKKIAGISG